MNFPSFFYWFDGLQFPSLAPCLLVAPPPAAVSISVFFDFFSLRYLIVHNSDNFANSLIDSIYSWHHLSRKSGIQKFNLSFGNCVKHGKIIIIHLKIHTLFTRGGGGAYMQVKIQFLRYFVYGKFKKFNFTVHYR